MTAASTVDVVWHEGGTFRAGRPSGPTIDVDPNGKAAPSPVEALLVALGSCVSTDVVDILAKRRTPVRAYSVRVEAERSDGTPRRVTAAVLNFTIAGAGIERVHAERAIDLAINKYCSVRDSLREDIPVSWTLALDSTDAQA